MCETAFVFPVAALKEKYSPLEQKRLQYVGNIHVHVHDVYDSNT